MKTLISQAGPTPLQILTGLGTTPLANAPIVTSLASSDTVLIQRNGQLMQIAWSVLEGLLGTVGPAPASGSLQLNFGHAANARALLLI